MRKTLLCVLPLSIFFTVILTLSILNHNVPKALQSTVEAKDVQAVISKEEADFNEDYNLMVMGKRYGQAVEKAKYTGKLFGEDHPVDITISAVGDCTLGYDESFSYSGSFPQLISKHGYGYPFKNVLKYFKDDDVTLVNLENTLTNAKKKAVKEYRYKGKPEYTKIINLSSIEAVNIANNHIYDYLQKGFQDTVDNLKKAEIGFFGEGYTYTKKIKGVNIGILGYRGWSATAGLKQKISSDIKELKKSCRIVIINFHWGVMRTYYPTKDQTALGRCAIDSGADLVLGHHPHVMQGIEEYKGKHIVYSLGNFAYGGSKYAPDRDTFIFRETFSVLEDNASISNTQIIPCYMSSSSKYNNYQPVPLSGSEARRVMNRLKTYSSKLKYGYNIK